MVTPSIKAILACSTTNPGISLQHLFLNCSLRNFHKMFKSVIENLAISLLGTYLTEMKTCPCKNLYVEVHTALFITAKK